ncbi:histone-like nucleoid-structuring protein, MvaT/MvaU family [Halomonas sp. I5-271120]|uniref:histone-like nucleoid-structuring protein, MvaT/MvaU family n=1 Tax=Halomonas sp. I5-271120 TaxID=3061632 RepID=UPI0027152189|nr:histone-like nucleoid-structuring protein, MvaT/MvaU family [Halomonas sp. I5-271120]
MAGSILVDYINREKEMKKLEAELERMRQDPKLQAAQSFQKDVQELMEMHEISPDEAVKLIKPELAETQAEKPKSEGRNKRRLKVFTNPHTGERVETRGGNNKQLKEWKAQYGEETVNGWGGFVE